MRLSIEFSNPDAVYFPGSEVSGHVELEMDILFRASLITVSLEGKAVTEWITSTSGNGSNAGATMIYASAEVPVWTKNPGVEGIQKGLYRFPFRFLLPAVCPPSFEGMNAYIRYQVRAEVDHAWHFPTVNKKAFSVVPTMDLNNNYLACQPVYVESSETVGSPLTKKGRIDMQVSIPKSGFVPGEEIPVSLSVQNDSSSPIVKTKLKLIQKVKIRGGSQMVITPFALTMEAPHFLNENTAEERKICKCSQAVRIDAHTNGRLNLSLRVPSLVQTMNSCSLVQVDYFLKVKVITNASFSASVKSEIPIVIGTVPIDSNGTLVTEKDEPPSYAEIDQDIRGNEITYKESVFGKMGTTRDMEYTEAFAPKYPYLEKTSEEDD